MLVQEVEVCKVQFKQAMGNALQEWIPLREVLCNQFQRALRWVKLPQLIKDSCYTHHLRMIAWPNNGHS